ncbi:methylglutaconyl-CoA hydratase, mitochondrial [Cephus cinctus]|uniref:Methylglutaconyl-CoA hydratase, mitochondrial n=1 Tax=Cephus cinctus TaxID=211228 RepID=A0AAJ7RC39_CEPCN|nr:methylglutaconyl-CoA hydratase, mitochondrial [Cephus cinctus]XP_024937696.1 methylglutaconyl-CoA hydratase, mitochondrial [Cephus cinctus]
MASLGTRVKAATTLSNFATIALRGLSTKVQLNPKDDSKETVVKYLDGKDNGIAVLGLNRPEARNAFSKSFVSQLSDTLSRIREDENIRVLIIRSLVPKVFCAGADLRERVKMEGSEVAQFVSSLRSLMNEVESLPLPVVSAIDGVALGGGLELALATDIRTAASEAKMGLVETKLAIIPGAGGTQRLPRIVGPAIAKELIFTARILDGDEAQGLGLVNRAVPQNKNGDAAYQAALSIAREILPNGPIGVRLAKEAITEGTDLTLKEGFEVEKKCYSQLLETEDRVEGLAAFTSKRVPVYKGM